MNPIEHHHGVGPSTVRRQRRRSIRSMSAILLSLALVAAACSGDDAAEDGTTTESPATTAADGTAAPTTSGDGTTQPPGDAEGTLVVAISSEPDNLDVHLSTASPTFLVLENVYDTLVEPDASGVFQPALAESWDTSEDGLTWTFNLRDDVTWHNGREFTADDVVFSYNRIMDEEVGAANAFRFASVDEVRAVDATTVELVLNQPDPNLLSDIGLFKGLSIVPQELVDDGGMSTDAIGTGPFRFVSYTPGDRIVLEANPDYWGDGPFVDMVEFRFIAEPTVALTNLQTGEVHLTNNIAPQEIPSLEEDPNIVLGTTPSIDYWYFTCNFDRAPFDDIDVRRALSFAIDREQVAQAAFFNAASPTQTAMAPQTFWAFDYEPFSYDPTQAQQLLDDAGVSDLTVDMMLTDEFPHTIQAAQVIQSQWADVGVNMEIRTLDFAGWLDEQGQGNYDCYVLGWLNNIDPETGYYAQHHSEGNFNFQNYSNPDVDDLLDQARVEEDDETRRDLFNQAAQIIVDEVSYGYLYHPDIVQAWLPGVEGYELHPDGKTRLRSVRLTG